MIENYYEILGVPEDADEETIRRAYLSAIKSSHPDHSPDDPKSHERSRLLNTAKNVLSDPKKRRRFDRKLKKERDAATEVNSSGTNPVNNSEFQAADKKDPSNESFQYRQSSMTDGESRPRVDPGSTRQNPKRFKRSFISVPVIGLFSLVLGGISVWLVLNDPLGMFANNSEIGLNSTEKNSAKDRTGEDDDNRNTENNKAGDEQSAKSQGDLAKNSTQQEPPQKAKSKQKSVSSNQSSNSKKQGLVSSDLQGEGNRSNNRNQNINLLDLVDLDRDIIFGKWELANGILKSHPVTDGGNIPVIEMPVSPSGDYTLEFDFRRLGSERNVLVIILPLHGKSIFLDIDGSGGGVGTFVMTPDRKEIKVVRGGRVTNQKLHHLAITVTKSSLTAELDGRPLISCQIDIDKLGQPRKFFRIPRLNSTKNIVFGIGHRANYEISHVQLITNNMPAVVGNEKGLREPVTNADTKSKWPVPNDAELKTAQSLLKDIYQQRLESAQKLRVEERLKELQELAKDVFSLIEKTEDTTEAFAILVKSIELSVLSGDFELFSTHLDALSNRFDVDKLIYIRDAVAEWSTQIKQLYVGDELVSARKRLLEVVNPSIDRAENEERNQLAIELLKLGIDLSAGAEKIELRKRIKTIEERVKRQELMSKLADDLKAKPDAKKSLQLGRYLCLERNKWNEGLPYLAKGDDEDLKNAALLDLNGGGDILQQVNIGDSWWEVAAKLSDGERDGALVRAASWYEQAVVRLNGLSKLRIQKRLDAVAALGHLVGKNGGAEFKPSIPKPKKSVDVLKSVDVKSNVIAGNWKGDSKGLRIDNAPRASRIHIPVELPKDYELSVEFTRTGRTAGVVIPIGGRPCLLSLGKDVFLERYKHPDGNLGIGKPDNEDGRKNEVKIRVATVNELVSVEGWVNGRHEFSWNGKPSELQLYSAWQLGKEKMFGLVSSDNSSVVFHSIRFKNIGK